MYEGLKCDPIYLSTAKKLVDGWHLSSNGTVCMQDIHDIFYNIPGFAHHILGIEYAIYGQFGWAPNQEISGDMLVKILESGLKISFQNA